MNKLLLLAVLFLSASPLFEGVGASLYFDRHVTLHLKSDPALRTFLAKSPENDMQLSVLLTFEGIPTSEEIGELSELGQLGTFTGHVATIRLSQSLLPQLASLDFVSQISYPRSLRGRLDVSVPEILADKVWNTVYDADSNSVNGSGVVVGIVDTGIDYHHGDFFFPNGTTKILSIWDQSTSGRTPEGFDYGNECSRAEIQAGTCSEVDGDPNGGDYISTPTGHGTAVAAVAASTGGGATPFASCLRFDGTNWQNAIGLCQEPESFSAPFLRGTSDYWYLGNNNKFNQIYVGLTTPGQYGRISWEYSRGGGQWGSIAFSSARLDYNFSLDEDQTARFTRNGTIFFRPPSDWNSDTVDGATRYWIRVKTDAVKTPAIVRQLRASPVYKGVAPGALIIAVKLKEGSDAEFLDGINYIIIRSQELNLPLVINDSFGDSLGPHDGTDPLELALTDISSKGVPIVVAAGNSRNQNIHAAGRLSLGQSVIVPWLSVQGQNESVDIWYSPTDSLGISVTTPYGTTVSGPTPDNGVDTLDGNVIILSSEHPTGKEWSITITSTTAVNSQINAWSFKLSAQADKIGTWDAWTEPGQFIPNPNPAVNGPYVVDESDTIDLPGTAKGVITVGAYVTKYYWRTGCTTCIKQTTVEGLRGVRRDRENAPIGNLTYGSGMGPTRDGRIKPDIVAPGAIIIVARAATTNVDSMNDPDDYHRKATGTSMAAPHAAGVIALMLQMNRYLSPYQIMTILREAGREDDFTGTIDKVNGSTLWGWGKLNALSSTLDATRLYEVILEIPSLGIPIPINLTLDGQNVTEIMLNRTQDIALEFGRDGNHTIELPEIIQVEPGARYKLTTNSATFSSGGLIRFEYRSQFFLDVESAYGYAVGSGWYDANSTAIATVVPTEAQGYAFQGWIGSVSSDSTTVQVTMDSSKRIVAVWRPVSGTSNLSSILGLTAAIAISLAIAAFVRYKTNRRRKNHT